MESPTVFGLPLHLWCDSLFSAVGEECGGFVSVDADATKDASKVTIYVKEGGVIPEFVWIEDDRLCYKVAIMEEKLPEMVPSLASLERRDERELLTEEEWWRMKDRGDRSFSYGDVEGEYQRKGRMGKGKTQVQGRFASHAPGTHGHELGIRDSRGMLVSKRTEEVGDSWWETWRAGIWTRGKKVT